MQSVSYFLMLRYLFAKHKDSNIAFMTKICFLGIFIGTLSLMLTLIITNGFEKVIHEKMQGINAPIVISSIGNKIDANEIRMALENDFNNFIAGVSGTMIKQVIVDHNGHQTVLFLKGIDPKYEQKVTTLNQKIISPDNKISSHKLSKLINENKILIGHKLARDLNVQVGQEIMVLIPEPTGKKRISLNKKKVTIGGIFKVGLEEYDNNLAFVSLAWLHKVFDERGVDFVTIKLKNEYLKKDWRSLQQIIFGWIDKEEQAIKQLKNRLPKLTVQSWKELYPALVSSLKLEKYVMFFILALITLVASMNMISLLFMQIQQKRRDIAILKAMGLQAKKISSIFLQLGMTITLLASLFGLACAFAIGSILERYPCIELPDVYYVSHLPARMDAEIFIVVFAVTMLIGFCATWLPARRAQKINIAQVLRHE